MILERQRQCKCSISSPVRAGGRQEKQGPVYGVANERYRIRLRLLYLYLPSGTVGPLYGDATK